MAPVDAIRARLRLLVARRDAESRMQAEFGFHIEMETEQLMRAHGLTHDEARRRALAAFGGVETHKEALRDGLGFASLSGLSLDVKLGIRMLAKYPGLTVACVLALALAVGIGAGWYDFMQDLMRPALPLPDGERVVEIEMRDPMAGGDERRLLHDFLAWRRDLRTVGDLGAYRTLDRTLALGDARPQPAMVAEITASAFRLVRVPPLLGRSLVEADEQPGAPPVIVLGFGVWRQQFGGRADVVGQTVQLGKTATTIVGVMPEGFAFPVNHKLWVPLKLRPSGYTPLEGPSIDVFGRLAPGVTQAQAYAEVTTLVQRTATASPRTHGRLRPRVLAYGGESPGDRSGLELAATHLPILLVLLVACANVGTLVYARTATREGELAMRHALGATRKRVITQLFVEALVLASVAALLGLGAAHWGLKWGMTAFYSGDSASQPFWIAPGLKPATILYAVVLTVLGAAVFGLFPALKATGSQGQYVKDLGHRGSTLRFGGVWTTVMIVQVAATVICIPPAMGITWEAVNDRIVRSRFPTERYLAFEISLDHEAPPALPDELTASKTPGRIEQLYGELARRLAQEPGVAAVVLGDRLPGMDPSVRRAEVEVSTGATPRSVRNLWTTTVGPGYFEAFDKPIVAGRDFDTGDRTDGARAVIVNEAFARRFMGGASPVGRRVRYGAVAEEAAPQPWFDIVGMVRDFGMTPTDFGEAPYVFHAASPATLPSVVMGVRVSGDPAPLMPRIRDIALALDADVRVSEVRSLEDLAWREDLPHMVGAAAIIGVVCLGLFVSAVGIFSLTSVSVARQTREIGLRSALGASSMRLLSAVLFRPVALVGSGVAAGNLLFVIFVWQTDLTFRGNWDKMLITSVLMIVVGLLACVQPARRALGVDPAGALKAGG